MQAGSCNLTNSGAMKTGLDLTTFISNILCQHRTPSQWSFSKRLHAPFLRCLVKCWRETLSLSVSHFHNSPPPPQVIWFQRGIKEWCIEQLELPTEARGRCVHTGWTVRTTELLSWAWLCHSNWGQSWFQGWFLVAVLFFLAPATLIKNWSRTLKPWSECECLLTGLK